MSMIGMGGGGGSGPAPTLRTTQVLVLALIMGVVMFTGVVVFLRMTGAAPNAAGGPVPPADMLLVVMGGLTIACTAASFVMKGVIVGAARRKSDAGTQFDERSLQGQFQILTILRAGLAEGPALFGTVIVMITGNWLGFVGTGFGLVMLMVVFPTRAAFDGFVRDVTGRMPGV